ncbi:MAG: nucleotidyltransferase domain-containing protein [Oscillospiraceae bacterium]|nr:nucleotidyltransferase domain-containing protein [Oscillospiraceae bacterium]
MFEKIGMTEKQFSDIVSVFAKFPQIERAVVFGSRAKGNFKKYSDVDICLYGEFDYLFDEHIKLELDELYVIFEFDVLSYNHLSNEKLKEHIDRVGITIYERNGNAEEQ